jgi:hypothetical protein
MNFFLLKVSRSCYSVHPRLKKVKRRLKPMIRQNLLYIWCEEEPYSSNVTSFHFIKKVLGLLKLLFG